MKRSARKDKEVVVKIAKPENLQFVTKNTEGPGAVTESDQKVVKGKGREVEKGEGQEVETARGLGVRSGKGPGQEIESAKEDQILVIKTEKNIQVHILGTSQSTSIAAGQGKEPPTREKIHLSEISEKSSQELVERKMEIEMVKPLSTVSLCNAEINV